MRYYIVILFILFLSLAVVSPSIAAKMKHKDTVYVDNDRVPLKQPEGVACGEGFFFVADTGNKRVVKYLSSAQGISSEAVYPLPNISPIVIQLNAEGTMYILDERSRSVVKVGKDGQVVGKLEPKGLPEPKTFIPRSLKLDKEGNIYLLDIFSARVVVLDAKETFIREVPFPAGYSFFSDLAIDAQGAIYLLDCVAGAIYKTSSDGQTFELFKSGLKEHMNFPTNLAIDSVGNFFLSDKYGSGLIELAGDGSFRGRKFGMGWDDAQLYYPAQLCINPQNMLVIADQGNNRIQIFTIQED